MSAGGSRESESRSATARRRRRHAGALIALCIGLAGLAGCASVPKVSPAVGQASSGEKPQIVGSRGPLSSAQVKALVAQLSIAPGDDALLRRHLAIEQAVQARLGELAGADLAADLERKLDVTLPGRGRRAGTLHPLTRVRLEIEQIFHGMGFEVRTGPWIETEWNNFDALNIPKIHPAAYRANLHSGTHTAL